MKLTLTFLSTASMQAVIDMARETQQTRLMAACILMERTHNEYAAQTNNSAASRIALDCARRCNEFQTQLAHGWPFDLSDLASKVELFNLACKVLDIHNAYRAAIATREPASELTPLERTQVPAIPQTPPPAPPCRHVWEYSADPSAGPNVMTRTCSNCGLEEVL